MSPTEQVLMELVRLGLLLKQDKAVPSVVGILTGETLRISWWSHPKAHLIFAVLSELADHPDVLITKLLHRKDTLIHRLLWPALLAVACERGAWQLRGLSRPAMRLLQRIDDGETPVRATGDAVRELEIRLLATAREIHTESGRHEMVLESWHAWSARIGCDAIPSASEARKRLETAAARLGARVTALPWRKLSTA